MKRIHKYKAWDSEIHEMLSWDKLTSSKHSDYIAAYLNGDYPNITMLESLFKTDRNGKEMYEGHIVILHSEETEKSEMFVIEYVM